MLTSWADESRREKVVAARLLVNCNESLFVRVFVQTDKAVKNVYLMSAASLYPFFPGSTSITSQINPLDRSE